MGRAAAIERSRAEAREARRERKAAADAASLKANQAARVAELRAAKVKEDAAGKEQAALSDQIASRLERELVRAASLVICLACLT